MQLKAISALLSYPTEDLQKASEEIKAALTEGGLFSNAAVEPVKKLMDDIASGDIYEMQETYVGLFDRSRTLSLNLFEHVHGESRERGSAMVDLVEMYRDGGFEPMASELPDHLPVLLEYLAMRSLGEVKEVLADTAHILEVLQTRLNRRDSNYACVFAALLQISGTAKDQEMVTEMLKVEEDDPEDLEALDAVWEEAQVTFGPDPNAGCPQVRDMLAQMDVPPITTPASQAPSAAAK
ncbi:MAG: nitrate reductase molybdenum cofactor assembly chaperone [Halocynthiibacter sp.]